MATQGVMGRVARQEWLKPVEENLQKLIHRGFASGGRGGQKVKNFLHGTWVGHPLHVILTDFPIGAWTAGLIFDLLDSATGRREYARGADVCLGIGVVSALGAAVTGVTDWQDVDPPARRIGLTHAVMNVTGVTLFAGSLIARRRGARGKGKALAALGFGVATMAARLGGNLVYEQRVGVDHTSGQTLPEDFAAVLADSELVEGQPKRANYSGVPILLVRRGNRIFAIAETCTHLGGPLSEGKLDENSIQCPWHGSRFALEDGRVIDGPAVHPAPCLEARVRNGQIEVRKSRGVITGAEPAAALAPGSPVPAERTGTLG